jgi:PAS domain S-box-containing protein
MIAPELMLSLVLDALPVRVFWKDRSSRFMGCNQHFADDACMRAPADLIGKSDFDLYHPADALAYRDDDQQVMASGKAKLGIEERVRTSDGGVRWLETNKMPLRDENGEIIGVLGTYSDVTERVRMREERSKLIDALADARNQAECANSAKTEFLTHAAHELRTPLNAIIGYGELLQESAEDGEEIALDDIKRINKAGRQLMSLVNSVLDFARIECGAVHLVHSAIDAPAMIDDVVTLLRPMAEKNGTVLKRTPGAIAPILVGDETKVRQCLINLVSNACKFTTDGAVEVAVREASDHGYAHVTVRDTGIGMTEEQMTNLFQPFAQADQTIGERFGGSGLGLAITRLLARAMGGDVTVQSEAGAGSTFTLTLPMAERPEMQAAA